MADWTPSFKMEPPTTEEEIRQLDAITEILMAFEDEVRKLSFSERLDQGTTYGDRALDILRAVRGQK